MMSWRVPAQTCRQADGYQPHLVSPEHGMRQLGSDALDQVSTPVAQCVQQVYSLLINAARSVTHHGLHCAAAGCLQQAARFQ
jgi:dynamin GTPase